MSKKSLKNLFLGYETPVYSREDGVEINTGVKFWERSLSGSITSLKKKILTSGIVRFFNAFLRFIAYTSTRGFGALFLSFGLLSITVGLGKAYFGIIDSKFSFSVIMGAVLSILAIPLLFIDKPFCIALQDFGLTDYIFFEFFSIKRMHRQSNQRGVPILVMVIVGLVLAGLGVFFSLDKVLAVILATVVIYFSFVSPEFAFFSIIIVLPLVPLLERGLLVLGCMIGAAFVSFMRKVIFGKRVYSIEQYDIIIAIFLVCVLISGIFMRGLESFESSLLLMLFALGYPLASNLIVNRRLADCALGALLISSVFTTISTAIDVFSVIRSGGITALQNYSATSTFGSSGVYAAYLAVVIIASVYFILVSRHKPVCAIYVAALAVNLICLVFTGRIDLLIALVCALIACLIAKRGGGFAPVAIFTVFLPLLMLALPAETFDLIMQGTGFAYSKSELLLLWERSWVMLADNLFTGIGIGSDSFASEIVNYGHTGVGNASNLFIEIGCEAGVIALFFFLLAMAVRVFHRSTYRIYTSDSQVSALSLSAGAMIIALTAFGMTEYIFADNTMYYLFWCIFGIGSAALRISKREHDDRVMYYGDLMSVDSSVIDVKIS